MMVGKNFETQTVECLATKGAIDKVLEKFNWTPWHLVETITTSTSGSTGPWTVLLVFERRTELSRDDNR